ncbi:cell envelope integrity EipB family protein [Blastochloris sulfoviridis]|uniref:Cell envelope integrity EipB family protein n=1 Tax=Blastochloris sulfoviridis TaxID=50712 RepID=A0A5M6HT30_9HYPH|nr:cell envelope integrity EipB family protein [Blastochloris sulfoviridis]KAA5599000.1 cell envelope integrity EipB family protein [Blastochloris sulfoviridis]
MNAICRVAARRAAALGLGLAAGIATAAVAGEAVAEEASAFIAHRAVYDLTLDRMAAKSTVQGARGRIVYEFSGNSCDGWAMSLRQVVQIDGEDGQSTVSDTLATSWEDVGGGTFRFANQNLVDRNVREVSEGRAERSADGNVVVQISKPAEGRVEIGSGVVFPTQHMRRLIETARKGETILSVKVFDGTDAGRKVYDTMGVVGRPVAPGGNGALEAAVRLPELKETRRWPVTVSYFEAGSDQQTPIYTLSFELFENGISRDLTLDYGDFRLKGTMATLDILPPTPCR